MSMRHLRAACVSGLVLLTISAATASQVQLQLVKQAAPDQLVSTDAGEAAQMSGGFVDRCEVLVDGKNPFPPHPQDGQRLKAAEVQLELAAGKHAISPGGHEFTVGADGTVATNDPVLSAAGTRVKLLMVPLMLETRDAESGARRVPALLQPIIDGDGRVFDRPWHFSPRYPTCALVYVPPGIKLVLSPQGAQFTVDATKVEVTADPTKTVQADGRTVVVTMFPLRFTFQRNGHQVGRGSSLTLAGNSMFMEHPSVYQWWAPTCDYKWLLPASTAPYELRVQHTVHELGRIAPGALLCPPLALSNRESPHSSLLVSRLDERSDGTYTFLAGIAKLKYSVGEAIGIRYAFHQDGISPAMSGAHLEALLRPEQFTPSPRDTPPWQTLAISGDAAQSTAKLPDDLATNRYRLRLAIVEAGGDATASPVYRDFVIGVVNPKQQAVAGLYLPARRWNYLSGEEIEAQGTLQLKSPAKGTLRLRLRGERLDRTLDAINTTELAAGRRGRGWVLSSAFTRALKPGEYTLSAVFADESGKPLAESLPQTVTLVSTVRPSLCPGVIDCYSHGWGDALLGGTSAGARQILGVGADVIRFDGWDVTLPTAPIEPMAWGPASACALPDDSDLPPADVLDAPPPSWRGFDEALPYRAAILPSIFPSDGPRIETQITDLLAEQRRYVRLAVQYFRRYPTYAGISYSHWSAPSYIGGGAGCTNPPPDDAVKSNRDAIWTSFCKANGLTGDPPTVWHPYLTPNGGAAVPANRELWEKWVRWINALIPNVHRDWAGAAAQVCPGLINTDSRGAPGYWNGPREAYDAYAYGNGYDSTAGLNLIEGVTNDDWGIEPYSLELMADIYSFGWRQGKPVWVGGWAQNGVTQSEYQREAIQTLARGALPALYGASLAPMFSSRSSDDWMHQDWGRRQATQRVFQTTAAYGQWAWRFATDKPLAILVSFSQSGLVESRTGYAQTSHHGAAIYEAYVACLLAGYSPTFVYEEEIASDPKLLSKFKALMLVDITQPLPEPITGALRAFAAGGGIVIADAAGADSLPASVRLPLTFDAYLKYTSTEFGKENNSTEYTSGYWWHMRRVAQEKRNAIRAALDKLVRPAAQAEKLGVLLTTARAGDGLLVYIANDTPLPVKYSTELPRPYAYVHQCWTSSDAAARITLHADRGVLYDALRLREVPLEKTADGLRFDAAFRDLSATMYVLLPRKIGGVALEGASRPGALTLRARALDDDGKAIAAPVPLEIIVSDPQKSERYHLYRAADSEGWTDELPVAANDLAGDWSITVRELLSGKSVTATLETKPAAAPESTVARPPLVVTDAAAVTAFLKSSGAPVSVALDRRQFSLQPIARRLADRLTAAGRAAQVRWLDELPRGPVWNKMLWSPAELPPSDPVRGAVILLGLPRDNSLLVKLADAGVLLREPSSDYPGEGGAVIAHVWSAFTGDEPALAVMAASDSGLSAAVAHIESILSGKPSASYDPAPSLESARAEVMPPMFRDTWAKHPSMSPAIPEAGLSALKPLAGQAVSSVEPAINAFGDGAIRAIAASGDSQVVRVGTDAGSQGRQFVDQLAMTPDGRVLITATTQPPTVFAQDVASGKELWSKSDIPFTWATDPRWMRDEPDYFAPSPRGDRVVVREKEQRLVCYEPASGKQSWEHSYASPDARVWRDAQRICFSGDGSRLIVSVISYLTDPAMADKLGKTATEALDAGEKSLDAEVRHRLLAIDPSSGQILWTRSERTIPVSTSIPRGHPFFPQLVPRADLDTRRLYYQPRIVGYYLSVSRDGSRIAAGDELGYQSVYAGDGSPLASYAMAGRPCLSPDGATLAVYRDGVVLVDLATGKQRTLKLQGEEDVSDVAWSADGRRLAVARWDGLVQVVEASGEPVDVVRQPRGAGAVLLASPKGGWFAGTSHGKLLRIGANGKLQESR